MLEHLNLYNVNIHIYIYIPDRKKMYLSAFMTLKHQGTLQLKSILP